MPRRLYFFFSILILLSAAGAVMAGYSHHMLTVEWEYCLFPTKERTVLNGHPVWQNGCSVKLIGFSDGTVSWRKADEARE